MQQNAVGDVDTEVSAREGNMAQGDRVTMSVQLCLANPEAVMGRIWKSHGSSVENLWSFGRHVRRHGLLLKDAWHGSR